MNKKEILATFVFIVLLIISATQIVYTIKHPVNYYDLPLEYRIRMEQRMIGW